MLHLGPLHCRFKFPLMCNVIVKIRSTLVVPSANFLIDSSPCWGLLSWMYSVNPRRPTSWVEEVWPPVQILWVCLSGNPTVSCRLFSNQSHRGDCVKCWVKINKQHSKEGVVTLKMCKHWADSRGDGILCNLSVLNANCPAFRLVQMFLLMR